MAKISHHGSCRSKCSTEFKCICFEKGNRWDGKCRTRQCETYEIRQSIYWSGNKTAICKNLLKTTKLLGYLPVKVSPHRTLNSSKFVIKCEELDKMDKEEIKKELQPQGIIAVKRISIRYSLYVLTIKGQTIPKMVNIGYLKKETRPYIPNPQRCFQCQNFGHTKN